jgi:antitoxin VapB
MKIAHTRTFKSGNSEAVRLPKEMGFGVGSKVQLIDNGDSITIRRPRPTMTPKELIEALDKLPKPKTVQVREPIEFPERRGV